MIKCDLRIRTDKIYQLLFIFKLLGSREVGRGPNDLIFKLHASYQSSLYVCIAKTILACLALWNSLFSLVRILLQLNKLLLKFIIEDRKFINKDPSLRVHVNL